MSHRIRLSLVVCVFRVEPYVGEFLASLRAQSTSGVEVIFVDDGSDDGSMSLVESFCATEDLTTRIIRQQNSGLANARNVGLNAAQGDWVTFPDPDDLLGDRYLEQALAAIEAADDDGTALITMNIINFDGQKFTDDHALRESYSGGNRQIDLTEEPQRIKLQAASSIFRRAIIAMADLRFDARIRPTFEDSSFLARYLLAAPHALVRVLPDAHYYYRRRADASSLTAAAWSAREKFLDVPRYGWLALLEQANRGGAVPQWLQFMVLYDLSWYLHYDELIHSPTRWLPLADAEEFISLLRQTMALVSIDVVLAYQITPMTRSARYALAALATPGLGSPEAVRVRLAPDNQSVLIATPGVSAPEVWGAAGQITPIATKVRSIQFFNTELARETLTWVPLMGPLTIRDGARERLIVTPAERRAPTKTGPRPHATSSGLLPRLRARLFDQIDARTPQVRRAVTGRAVWVRRPVAVVTKLAARLPRTRRTLRDSWVFIDRDTQAQDNAEHLYRWTRTHHPEINAWFVLRRSSADWRRLHEEGFRLIRFGSFRHRVALLHARHLISSHVDHYIVEPLDRRLYGRPRWFYSFLQHGITKDDISRWLNLKEIDFLVTGAARELESISGANTPYTLTEREVHLTGFPRWDRLVTLAEGDDVRRDLIVVAPTWREYLLAPASGRGNHRRANDGFATSDYVTNWTRFLTSPELREFARRHDLTLALLPHPNLEAHVGQMKLPAHVKVFTYQDNDVQRILARGKVFVTDYSSLAFEAAYLDRPVVYFQFDEADFFARHPHRPGYFDYDQDGFGPRVHNVDAAVSAVVETLDGEDDQYAKRRRDFFPHRDTQNSARAFAAIQSIGENAPGVD